MMTTLTFGNFVKKAQDYWVPPTQEEKEEFLEEQNEEQYAIE